MCSMQINSTPAFKGRAFTKEGNEYEHTKFNKRVGTLVGMGVGAGTGVLAVNYLGSRTIPRFIMRGLNVTKQCKIGSAIIGALAFGIAFRKAGAIIDGFVNRARCKQADKAAQAKVGQ